MSSKKRLLGLDLLKITATLMIIMLHMLSQGGIIDRSESGSIGLMSAKLLFTMCYCAVNCYGLITGFVMYRPNVRSFNYSRIIPLWLQVFVYDLIISLLFIINGTESLSEESLTVFIPVISNKYWYFTAYFGMFFFIPFFNILIDALDKKQFIAFLASLYLLFSILPAVFCNLFDPFLTNNGYSMPWLIVLYFTGAFIRRFGDDIGIKKKILAAVYVISSVIASTLPLLGYSYTSPLTSAAAAALLLLFKDIEVKGRLWSGVISWFAPATFGVYLIHVHPMMFSHILLDRFAFMADMNPILMILSVIGTAAVLFVVLSAAEYIRILLFRLLKVGERADRLVTSAADKVKEAYSSSLK